jgi:hypothetical protein
MWNNHRFYRVSGFVIGFAALLLVSPTYLSAWRLAGNDLVESPWPSMVLANQTPYQADLNGDGRPEELILVKDESAQIRSSGKIVWQSPQGWRVSQAQLADLNHDGRLEAVLLVWRDFKPWPVDQFLPVGGRISTFHNDQNQSCHLILIGWKKTQYSEVWAGSALAEPIRAFAVGDLRGNGQEELITLDGSYNDDLQSPAQAVKIWNWDGFGFKVSNQLKGQIQGFQLVWNENHQGILFVSSTHAGSYTPIQ